MFDVVIATYNRHYKVSVLVRQLLSLSREKRLGRIIVVDSSDAVLDINTFDGGGNLTIVKSSHKNQPYQRFLGTSICTADYILFLDDDMEIIDDTFCEVLSGYLVKGYAGINLRFKNVNEFLGNLDKTVIPKTRIAAMFRALSGYPDPGVNEVWMAGIRGRRQGGREIQYVSGGAFLGRREWMFKGLSASLFDIYEQRLGKGEDTLTGLALSKKASVWADERLYFLHNDQRDSTYTINHFQYYKRVTFSRLFLSFEWSRLLGKPYFFAIFHYWWYMLWRIVGVVVNAILNPQRAKIAQIRGMLTGFVLTFSDLLPKYLLKRENQRSEYWNSQAAADSKSAISV